MSRPIVQETLFAQESVKMLSDGDFAFSYDQESETKINIRYKECMLVLFYGNNAESRNLVEIWALAASQVAGPVYAACNLMVSKKVSEAFTSLNLTSGSLHWAALRTVPFIMVYQNGWPVAFYNGDKSVQAIIDYSLTLACRAEYHEPFNNFGGMEVDNNQSMKGVEEYGDTSNPFRKISSEYKSGQPIRAYDKQDKLVVVGSPAEKAEAAEETRAAAAAGIPTLAPATRAPEAVVTPVAPGTPGGGEQGVAATPTPQALPPIGGGVTPLGEAEGGVATPTPQT